MSTTYAVALLLLAASAWLVFMTWLSTDFIEGERLLGLPSDYYNH